MSVSPDRSDDQSVPIYRYNMPNDLLPDMPEIVESALYMVFLRLMHRDYAGACRLLPCLDVDGSLSPREARIAHAALVNTYDAKQHNADMHPDAHAARLRLALIVLNSADPVLAANDANSLKRDVKEHEATPLERRIRI